MKKLNKGHYGYLNRRKHGLLIRIGILTLGIVLLLATGIISTGSIRNLLTVVAMVTVLPWANQAVVFLAIMRFQSRPEEEYRRVEAVCGRGVLDTELMITSRTDKTMRIDYAYIHERGVICYTSDPDLDTKKTAEYINSYLEGNDLKTHLFIFHDFSAFLRRLQELPPEDRNTCSEDLLRIEGVMRAIAL